MIFLQVILSILSHLGCCNFWKLKSSRYFALDCTYCGFTAPPTHSTRFSLRENHKYSLWTLFLQSLRRSDRCDEVNIFKRTYHQILNVITKTFYCFRNQYYQNLLDLILKIYWILNMLKSARTFNVSRKKHIQDSVNL